MTYNNISFNAEWVKTKTLEEFITHEQHHGLTDKQLTEVYNLCNPKPVKSHVKNKSADEKIAD